MSDDGVRRRIYLVREALGDGYKRAMPMTAFADLLNETSESTRYDSSVVSRMEQIGGRRVITLDDIATVAAVDPERRGRAWLAWGEVAEQVRAKTSAELNAELAAETGALVAPPRKSAAQQLAEEDAAAAKRQPAKKAGQRRRA